MLAIVGHEVAHAWAAKLLGDDTAARAGRTSLNPLRHLDLLGSILLPGMLFVSTGGAVCFGWAKPVPVAYGVLSARAGAWVALAGPAANGVMALCWWAIGGRLASVGIAINVAMLVMNMLPIGTLDGARVMRAFRR